MKRRTIRVHRESGDRSKVSAKVLGRWAAHLRVTTDHRVPASERWQVTHIPTGGALVMIDSYVSEAEAIACVRALHRRLPRMRGKFGVASSVAMDELRAAHATIAEVLAEGRAR